MGFAFPAQIAVGDEARPLAAFTLADVDLLQDLDKQGFDGPDGIQASAALRANRNSLREAVGRKGRGGADQFAHGVLGGVRLQQIAEARFETAAATRPAFVAANPAAKLKRFKPRQARRKGAVGGFEDVVAFVENDARQGRLDGVFVDPFTVELGGELGTALIAQVIGRLRHDECVIGDHQ